MQPAARIRHECAFPHVGQHHIERIDVAVAPSFAFRDGLAQGPKVLRDAPGRQRVQHVVAGRLALEADRGSPIGVAEYDIGQDLPDAMPRHEVAVERVHPHVVGALQCGGVPPSSGRARDRFLRNGIVLKIGFTIFTFHGGIDARLMHQQQILFAVEHDERRRICTDDLLGRAKDGIPWRDRIV
ncbi:TPA: hypothetical protein ACYLM8_001847 [Burkholderia lata]